MRSMVEGSFALARAQRAPGRTLSSVTARPAAGGLAEGKDWFARSSQRARRACVISCAAGNLRRSACPKPLGMRLRDRARHGLLVALVIFV
jgi:hypothetical protein